MARYRKKPVVIDAVQFDGTAGALAAIEAFVGSHLSHQDGSDIRIKTLEGRAGRGAIGGLNEWVRRRTEIS